MKSTKRHLLITASLHPKQMYCSSQCVVVNQCCPLTERFILRLRRGYLYSCRYWILHHRSYKKLWRATVSTN
jgi:hypothetical protein